MNRLVLMILQNLPKVPWAYAKLCHYARLGSRCSREESWAHIRKIMALATTSGNVTLQVSGQEYLQTEGGYMLYGNHQGLFDVVAIAATCPVPLAAVYKKELANVPFLKQVYACTGSYAMDREDVRQSLQVIQAVTKEVSEGRRFVIFPEGTRSKRGNEMGAFHGGSFRCALKAKCPIIPMAFIDSFRVLDGKGSAPVTVQLHYLEPIPYEAYQNLKTVELAELVRSRIEEAIRLHTAANPRQEE